MGMPPNYGENKIVKILKKEKKKASVLEKYNILFMLYLVNADT